MQDTIGRKNNRQILRDFLENFILPRITETGLWAAPDPAPLAADEVEQVFEEIAKLDDYKRQHFVTATDDGHIVHLLNGTVFRGD